MPSAVISTSATDEIVAAPTSPEFIRVHGYVLASAGTVSVKWQSASTDKTGAMPFAANDKMVAPSMPLDGWFDCAPGEALNLNLSASIAVTGHLHYSIQG